MFCNSIPRTTKGMLVVIVHLVILTSSMSLRMSSRDANSLRQSTNTCRYRLEAVWRFRSCHYRRINLISYDRILENIMQKNLPSLLPSVSCNQNYIEPQSHTSLSFEARAQPPRSASVFRTGQPPKLDLLTTSTMSATRLAGTPPPPT